MSLILEALKKSEAQRRLGEAPTLATPFGAAPRRRGVLPWLFLVFALTAGSGAAWWWLHHARVATPASFPAPTSMQVRGNEPPLTANPPPANPSSAQHAAPRIAANPPVQNVPAQPQPPPQTKPPLATAPPLMLPENAPPPSVSAHTVAATNSTPAPARPAQASPLSPPPQPPAPQSATPASAVAGVPVADALPAAAPIKPTPAPEPAVPELNDLPLALRKDMPPLTVTMQMYSADPARRFVVIDGQRKKEGDTVRDVAVHEIRASGVVLEFRGQRFLWPRPGS